MSSVYVTGDNHANISRYSPLFLPKQFGDSTRGNVLIIAGDWGFLWDDMKTQTSLERQRETKTFDYISKMIGAENRLLIVPGNHENYMRIEDLETTTIFGADAKRLNENIYFAERGQIYTINDLDNKDSAITVFTLGGAYSNDRSRRVLNETWWEHELATSDELEFALSNLEKHNNQVDFVVTHQAPLKLLGPYINKDYNPHEEELQLAFARIVNNVNFKQWYFGHHHIDRSFTQHYQCCYFQNYQLK